MTHHTPPPAAEGKRMDVRRFAECIERLTSEEIDAIAVAHRSLADSVSDEVEQWQVLLAVDRSLRAAHRSREAGLAAATARRLVVQAAERGERALPDGEVTEVARFAGDIARSLVAESLVDECLCQVIDRWAALFESHGLADVAA
ncbi:MAG TPA: hypothetical protein VMK16_07365 [Acidimicrobiales bacterium]|nr:hypothetical protein [Acidimicrobiales bacterium]